MSRKFDMIIRGTIEIPEELNPMEMDEVEIAEYIGKNFGDFQYNGEAVYGSMPELTEEELRKGLEEGYITLGDCGFNIGGFDSVIGCDIYEYLDDDIDYSGMSEEKAFPIDKKIKMFRDADGCAKRHSLSDIICYDSEEGQQRNDELKAYEGLQGLGFFSDTSDDKLKPLKDVIKKFDELMNGFGCLNVSSECEGGVVSWTLTFYVDNALPINEPAYQCTFTDSENKGADMVKELNKKGSSLYSFIIGDIVDTTASKSGLAYERCMSLCTILTRGIESYDDVDIKIIQRGLESGGVNLMFKPSGSKAQIGKLKLECPELKCNGDSKDIKLSYTSEELATFVYNAADLLSLADKVYLYSYLRASGYFCDCTLYGNKDTKALDDLIRKINKATEKNGYTLSTYRKWSSFGHFNHYLPDEINFYFKKVEVDAAFRVGMIYTGIPLKDVYVYQQLLIGLDEVQNDNIGNVLYDDISKIEADIRIIGTPDAKSEEKKNKTPLFTSC